MSNWEEIEKYYIIVGLYLKFHNSESKVLYMSTECRTSYFKGLNNLSTTVACHVHQRALIYLGSDWPSFPLPSTYSENFKNLPHVFYDDVSQKLKRPQASISSESESVYPKAVNFWELLGVRNQNMKEKNIFCSAVLFASVSVKLCIGFNFEKKWQAKNKKKKVIFLWCVGFYMLGGMFHIHMGDFTCLAWEREIVSRHESWQPSRLTSNQGKITYSQLQPGPGAAENVKLWVNP